ncbi:tissue inhibitor of metalloproteinase [Algoriphagus ratkowskyi]|uniref:Tissue inhibitor of metalloproteinase n=1 Tax=Algoriphagus ratkowskyi TaxID=57028 RepID=A0A2W7RG99_9BACT|nr:hypothetical protein [Algoriphagus ratkowskyi]PZX59181.1 tissue inhibitor of metalloproteinase [Algoriphagus ratkowskyi]TXD77536.1 hypothetical protein ESW18_12130 [Algoriphagus ratkowskyi]
MKYLIIFIFLVLSDQALACRCAFSTPSDRFLSADFVGRIKIVKVYPNEADNKPYKADVEIIEHFKGDKIKSIYIAGRSDGSLGSSCDVFYPEGSDLLVFARNDSGGRVSFGMCSFPIDFKNNRDKDQRDLESIRVLSKYDSTLTATYEPIISSSFSEFLESKKGIELKEQYALFEVILNDQVCPSEINLIKGFEAEIDSEIIDELFKSTWEIRFHRKEDSVEGALKVIVPVYFYLPERGEKSFLSTNGN